MKFTKVLIAAASILAATNGIPVNEIEEDAAAQVPSEAIIGYIDFGGADDIAILPFQNSTDSGLLFVNTTIYNQATVAAGGKPLKKRDAEAEAWHWLRFRPGQPLYKREAEAEAAAEAWHWLRFRPGQPLYKREAEAEAEAWHWLRFRPGQPLYKREADAEAWHWLRFRPGQPLY
ncbi:Mating factor alpha [Nakaseomyces bracarensis]|uniref:Mating factor alpha n=1 Tax=Nakaseomyces bracarensis TaxID=273131 RepID=A0ABR4NNS9_9SACH